MKGDWVSSELAATFSLREQTHRGRDKVRRAGLAKQRSVHWFLGECERVFEVEKSTIRVVRLQRRRLEVSAALFFLGCRLPLRARSPERRLLGT